MIFHCTDCNTPIGELTPEGTQTLLCPRCRFKYQVVSGAVLARNTRQITHQRQTRNQPGQYEREYDFRLARPEGDFALVSFRVPGKEDQFVANRNDVVSVVHAMRGDVPEKVVATVNQTTGRVVGHGKPGDVAMVAATQWGFLTMIAVAVVAAINGEAGIGLLLSVPAGLGVMAVAKERLRPRHALTAAQERMLVQATSLLDQKQRLEEQRARVQADRREKEALRARLTGLKSKMEAVGTELYGSRIASVNRAIPLLEEQIALDDELLAAYGRTVTMLEIELESRSAAEELPEAIGAALEAGRAELAALQSRMADIDHQLAANEEVERLLQPG